MPTETAEARAPRRGEIWETTSSRRLLVLQRDVLNDELATVVAVIVTEVSQRAPEPVRVRLAPPATGLERALWVKIPLLVTLPAAALARVVATLDPDEMSRVDAAVVRVLDLGMVRPHS